jgi:hypothetical protein
MIVRTEKFFKKKIAVARGLYALDDATFEVYEVRRRVWWLLWIIPLYVQYKVVRRNT